MVCRGMAGGRSSGERAFTLVEVIVALGIAMAVLGTLVYGYLQSYRMTDAVVMEAAAQRLTLDRLQVVQSAQWSSATNWASTELGRFNNTVLSGVPLELPLLTSNRVLATLTTTVTYLGSNPPLSRIQVQCVWSNLSGSGFTNQLVTLRAPN